jgi:hypothetical protein
LDNDISVYNPNSTGYTIVKDDSFFNSTDWDIYSVNPIMLNYSLVGQTSQNPTKFNITGVGIAIHSADKPNLPAGYVGSENFFTMKNISSGSWAEVFEYYNEDTIPANESTLKMWRYNGSWHTLPNTDIDTDDNLVYSGNVTHFSTFGILGAPVHITNCANLTNPNKVYALTQNIYGVQTSRNKCIDIQADNVTLDCQGHTIDYNDTIGTYGIYLNGETGATIKNCIVTGYNSARHAHAAKALSCWAVDVDS